MHHLKFVFRSSPSGSELTYSLFDYEIGRKLTSRARAASLKLSSSDFLSSMSSLKTPHRLIHHSTCLLKGVASKALSRAFAQALNASGFSSAEKFAKSTLSHEPRTLYRPSWVARAFSACREASKSQSVIPDNTYQLIWANGSLCRRYQE